MMDNLQAKLFCFKAVFGAVSNSFLVCSNRLVRFGWQISSLKCNSFSLGPFENNFAQIASILLSPISILKCRRKAPAFMCTGKSVLTVCYLEASPQRNRALAAHSVSTLFFSQRPSFVEAMSSFSKCCNLRGI